MPEPDAFYPPAQYGAVWLIWMFVALAALVATTAVLLYLRRGRPIPEPAAAPPAPVEATVPPISLRAQYRAQITQAEKAYLTGEIDARAAHLEFSRIVRAFVHEYSGIEAPVLTLSELRERKAHTSLLNAVRGRFYPGGFQERPSLSVAESANVARSVVARWR